MKKEVRGGVSLVLASAMLVASPMAAGMTETVQAEELTVDSKVAQIQGESIIPRADQVPGNEELFAQYVEQTFYGEESESYRTPAVYGNIGQNVLTGADKYVYNELKKIAANIADGKAADGIRKGEAVHGCQRPYGTDKQAKSPAQRAVCIYEIYAFRCGAGDYI